MYSHYTIWTDWSQGQFPGFANEILAVAVMFFLVNKREAYFLVDVPRL